MLMSRIGGAIQCALKESGVSRSDLAMSGSAALNPTYETLSPDGADFSTLSALACFQNMRLDFAPLRVPTPLLRGR